jgi:nicotinate-nucleotide--dimethylbenzimidazole phosphoribosyltransferase
VRRPAAHHSPALPRTIAPTAAAIQPIDPSWAAHAQAELDRKTKPRRSLGRLEDLAVQLAAIRRRVDLLPLETAIVVAAADHGYAARRVSAYPQEVTRQMLLNFAAGGAAVAVLSRRVGARLLVIDVGAVQAVRHPNITSLRIAPGTADATAGPAMTAEQMLGAMEAGIVTAAELAAEGIAVLALGDMGIGNSTAASAVCSALLEVAPAEVCGPGTGLGAAGVARKAGVVEQALRVNAVDGSDPLRALAAVGGLEIAFLAGLIVGAAAARLAIVLDGFIVGAAALVAARLASTAVDYMIAAHLSPEPGHRLALRALGLAPLLQFELRLGEGSGAALVLPIIEAAAALLVEMATFESAGVSDTGR